MKNKKQIPIEINKVYEASIEGYNHEGMGVAKIEGFTVFVKEAIKEERLLFRVNEIKKTYAYGEIEKILKASNSRIIPQCPYTDVCGGCALLHMDYKTQLDMKKDIVINALERIGNLKGLKVEDTIGMEYPFGYRNNAQFSLEKKDNKTQIGFYSPKTHELIDIKRCLLLPDVYGEIIDLIRLFIEEEKISIYNRKTKEGLLKNIVIRSGFVTKEIMVILVLNQKALKEDLDTDKLITLLTSKIYNIKSIQININPKDSGPVLGQVIENLYGPGHIFDYIDKLIFKISPLSFFQTNPQQTKILYQKALDFAGIDKNHIVVDAYCGIGTISLAAALRAKKVYGIEWVHQAVVDANENARLNNIYNVDFIEAKAEEEMIKMAKNNLTIDRLILDPPRKGCDEKLIQAIGKLLPSKIVYVSCNPSTLARDLESLVDFGYKIDKVQPVDQFPQTRHVECCVLMSRVEK